MTRRKRAAREKPAQTWAVSTVATKPLDCAGVAIVLEKETPSRVLLGLFTDFSLADRTIYALGTFEVGLKRMTITVRPTNFSASADGFLTAHRPARIIKRKQTRTSESGQPGMSASFEPELGFGAEGLKVKLGSIGGQTGPRKNLRQSEEEVELQRSHVRPLAEGAIQLRYREPEDREPLEGRFEEIVRGVVGKQAHVSFDIEAKVREDDYVVGRRKAGRAICEKRIPIVRSAVLYLLRKDKLLLGSYCAKASCFYGKAKSK